MTQGNVIISAPDGSIDLRALADWFRADYAFRSRTRLIEEPIKPGHMGGMIEAIAIAVGGGGAVNTLIRYFFIWLGKHQDKHSAHLTLQDDTGRELSFNIDGLSDPNAIIQKAFDFFSQSE